MCGGADRGILSDCAAACERFDPNAAARAVGVRQRAEKPASGLSSHPIGAYGPSKHTVVAVAEQAALSLVGTAITVTVLCPSLVKTGMSEIGDDPLDVAAAALSATNRGQFVLTPPQWHGAIVRRAERFVDGQQPESAEPTVSRG